MLQAASSQVLFPMKSLNFSKLHNPSGPPLWSGGQSSWLQSQMSGFDSRRYQIFWEVVGLERDALSLMSTIEELVDRKSSGSGLEERDYVRRDPQRWPSGTLYPQKLALTSQTRGGRSIGIVRSWNNATEFSIYFYYFLVYLLPNSSSYSWGRPNLCQKWVPGIFLKVKGGRCVLVITWPPSVGRFSRQCGILDISQPCRLPQPVTGIALLYFLL
jgi:hypothetical protein